MNVLVLTHMENIVCIGPLNDQKLDALKNDMNAKSISFDVYINNFREFLLGMDSWVEEVVTEL